MELRGFVSLSFFSCGRSSNRDRNVVCETKWTFTCCCCTHRMSGLKNISRFTDCDTSLGHRRMETWLGGADTM